MLAGNEPRQNRDCRTLAIAPPLALDTTIVVVTTMAPQVIFRTSILTLQSLAFRRYGMRAVAMTARML
jgi:hypothetical protein